MSETLFETIKERAGSEPRSVGWYRKQLRYLSSEYHNKPITQLLSDENADDKQDEMFQDTLNIIEDCNLTHLHIFPYSIRKNTPAEITINVIPIIFSVDIFLSLSGIDSKHSHTSFIFILLYILIFSKIN